MEDRNLVRALLAGSSNIDRMKRQVEQVVGMLLGFLEYMKAEPDFFPVGTVTTRGEQGRVERSIVSGEFVWHVSPSGSVTCLHCREADGVRITENVYYMRLSRPEENHFPQLAYVHLAHEALPILVNGVLNASPRVREAIQPLLDAASYKF